MTTRWASCALVGRMSDDGLGASAVLHPVGFDRMNHALGEAPIQHRVYGRKLMQEHHKPEHALKGPFRRLVAERALGEERAWPASQQTEDMQRRLGNPPLA